MQRCRRRQSSLFSSPEWRGLCLPVQCSCSRAVNPRYLGLKDPKQRANMDLVQADKLDCEQYLATDDIVEGSPNLNLCCPDIRSQVFGFWAQLIKTLRPWVLMLAQVIGPFGLIEALSIVGVILAQVRGPFGLSLYGLIPAQLLHLTSHLRLLQVMDEGSASPVASGRSGTNVKTDVSSNLSTRDGS